MHESYYEADAYSAFIPVVYCSVCERIRGEEEMIAGSSECINCKGKTN